MTFARELPDPNPTVRARSLRRRMTWSEQKLWKELRKLDANFRRQAPVGRYFADFASHGSRLLIEVDGGIHERLESVVLNDALRQLWLEGEGYTVLRFTDRQVVEDVEGCIEAVRCQLGRPDAETEARGCWTSMPNSGPHLSALQTPPSPTLPPSRRKGV